MRCVLLRKQESKIIHLSSSSFCFTEIPGKNEAIKKRDTKNITIPPSKLVDVRRCRGYSTPSWWESAPTVVEAVAEEVVVEEVVDNKWGPKVDREHRRRQTGSNWREPASRSPDRRRRLDGGEVGVRRGVGERRRESERARCQESDTKYTDKFRTLYTARRRVALASPVDLVESIQADSGRTRRSSLSS